MHWNVKLREHTFTNIHLRRWKYVCYFCFLHHFIHCCCCRKASQTLHIKDDVKERRLCVCIDANSQIHIQKARKLASNPYFDVHGNRILYWPPATIDTCGYNTSYSLNYVATLQYALCTLSFISFMQENVNHLQGSNLYENENILLGQFNDINWTVERGLR